MGDRDAAAGSVLGLSDRFGGDRAWGSVDLWIV